MGREAIIVGNTSSYSFGKKISSRASMQRTLFKISNVLTNFPKDYSFHVTTLLDKTPTEVRSAVDTLASRASKTNSLLLFYYFGHGILSSSLDLLFVHLGGTPEIPNTLRLQAIEAIISASDLTKSLFILDCCYAGADPKQIRFSLNGSHCRIASTTPSARAFLTLGYEGIR